MFHYTYRITNIVERMHYYGTRSCKVHPALDLGTSYFSSSTNKDFIRDQKKNPQNYKYKVLKCFENRETALQHEIMLHHKFDVKNHPSFYNKANQTSTRFTVNTIVGKAISAALRGKPSNKKGLTWEEIYSPLALQNLRAAAVRAKTKETRDKLSKSHKGKKLTQQHKDAIGRAQLGKTYSVETCNKIKQSKLENHVLRNTTYDDYYGERSENIKHKMSVAHTDKPKPLTLKGKQSVSNSNTLNKTRVFQLVFVNGEQQYLTVQQIQQYFAISIDMAKSLARFEKPNNKSKYADIYNTLVSVTDAGVLKDFTLR